MPLSEQERGTLTKAVERCRGWLEADARDQLERIHGFSRDGQPRAIEALGLTPGERGTAEALREWHRHLAGLATGNAGARAKAALRRMAEETAFTVLHRLAAVRMAEERGVLRPCLRDGLQSDGFRLYALLAGGALGTEQDAYRCFLERVFDEIGHDLPALFDRREPRSLLFPAASVLEQVVAELTVAALARVWQDDEAIGWVYQDFHSAAERQSLRKGRKEPRDAYQLAVRNQLFTPRWVVEFLTDNSLGRLWVEMTGGETDIAEHCAYLLHKPVETPVPVKDPRELRVLDPACGSGHFLLYAFDLLQAIYREAHERRLGALHLDYPAPADLERALPVLILGHNLFGVDIDPRAIQVAALALWLRAQRAWRDLPADRRPVIERMNLVCAEPMPGDQTQLDAFADGLQPPVLGELVRAVWAEMRPVGEMGLLLRIDQRLRALIDEAKARWGAAPDTTPDLAPRQAELFADAPNWSGPRHSLSDLAGAPDIDFWSDTENRVVEALAQYAAAAGDQDRLLRRLFAEDAERGLALIDLSRIRYDVVLMNPPFGQPAVGSKEALDSAYPACGHEIYAMFFQRTLELLKAHGMVGAITERDWLSQSSLRGLREQVFGKQGAVALAADLGYGVLEAKVETAAVIVAKQADQDTIASWVRLVTAGRKEAALLQVVAALRSGAAHAYLRKAECGRFKQIQSGAYAYWMSNGLLERYGQSPSVASAVGEVKQGTATASDFRFLRLGWEVSPEELCIAAKWPRFAKGGDYRPFWDDVYLVVNWARNASELAAHPRAYIRNSSFYGQSGITWPRRTNLPLGPRVLPAGNAFSDKAPTLFPSSASSEETLAVLSARPYKLLLSPWLNTADASPQAISKSYEVGIIKRSGWPPLAPEQTEPLSALTRDAVGIVRPAQVEDDPSGETCTAFTLPPVLLTGRHLPLADATRRRVEAREDRFAELAEIQAEIDAIVADAYGFTDADRRLMDEELEPAVATFPEPEADPDEDLFRTAYLTKQALPGERLPGGLEAEIDVRVEHRRGRQTKALRDEEALCRLFALPPRRLAAVRRRLDLLRDEDRRRSAADLVSWAVGVAFGRWDVRLLDQPDWHPDWPDPFAALPRCPLGQLVDADGLPATSKHIASPAWMAARTDACRLPTVERGADGIRRLVATDGSSGEAAEIHADGYPLQVAWEGILQDDVFDDDAPVRHADDLYRRVSLVLEHSYGGALAAREAELAAALGVDSLRTWLRRPGGFFADHLARYSKSRRRAPVYWPLATAGGGLTLWLYYPRLTADMLSACANRLHRNEQSLQREEARLRHAREQDGLSAAEQARLDRIATELAERAALREALRDLLNRGFTPHLDDGAVVNAAPLARWFRNATWRDAAAKVWDEVQRGEHDWSHLALWLRPEPVLERCRHERDLAIAHDREDLYEPPPERPRRGRRRRAQPALDLPEPDADA